MLTEGEQAAIRTALDKLSAQVDLARQAATDASPWWRHLTPFQTDVDRAAQSAREFADSLAALYQGLQEKAAQLATSPDEEHEGALEIVTTANRDGAHWTSAQDLADAIRARPGEVAGQAAQVVKDVGKGALLSISNLLAVLPWVVIGAAVLAVVWFVSRFLRKRG